MKKFFFVLAAAVVFMSCNDTKMNGSDSKDHASAADANAEKTKMVYDAIESGDVSKLDSLFTEDVIDHNGGPMGQDIKGRDSVKAMLGQIHNYFDNLNLEMLHHATSTDGQYHYVTVRMTGKAKANPWGIPPGTEIDDTSVDLLKIRDGRAAEHWGFMSMADFNEIMKSMEGGGGNQPQPAADTTKKQ